MNYLRQFQYNEEIIGRYVDVLNDHPESPELAKKLISHLLNALLTEHALFLEEKLYQLQFMSSQERYKALIAAAPEVLQRVTLTDIASYLGVSRETLSRIRNKK